MGPVWTSGWVVWSYTEREKRRREGAFRAAPQLRVSVRQAVHGVAASSAAGTQQEDQVTEPGSYLRNQLRPQNKTLRTVSTEGSGGEAAACVLQARGSKDSRNVAREVGAVGTRRGLSGCVLKKS